MGLMLCGTANPACALWLEELGLRIYTAEELSYCILKYPLLFMDELFGEALFYFLAEGAGETVLAAELRELSAAGVDRTVLLSKIPEAIGYCNAQEAARFRLSLQKLKSLSQAEYWKKKGDFLFSLRKFGKAAAVYERVLNGELSGGISLSLRGRLLCGEGCAYANLFLSEKAYRCFVEAYELLKDRNILKRIYFLSLIEPTIGVRERYLSAVEGETQLSWDREYEEARQRAASGAESRRVAEIFKGDPVQRAAAAAETVRRWKEEYRSML